MNAETRKLRKEFVIEESKWLNDPVMVQALKVYRKRMEEAGTIFDDASSLADLMYENAEQAAETAFQQTTGANPGYVYSIQRTVEEFKQDEETPDAAQ